MVEFVYLAGDERMYGFLTGILSNILFIYVLFAAVIRIRHERAAAPGHARGQLRLSRATSAASAGGNS